MGNMSYCRFQNTVLDLRDCELALEGLLNCDTTDGENLSREELDAATTLVELCVSITQRLEEYVGTDDTAKMLEHLKDALNTANKDFKDAQKAEQESDEAELCAQCNGSGEGMHDGTTCSYCNGKGVR